MISFRNYQVCLLDLFTDAKTGRLSASKLWLHVANVIMSKVMLTSGDIGWEMMVAYGAIVGGSYVAIQAMKWKIRDANPPSAENTAVAKE